MVCAPHRAAPRRASHRPQLQHGSGSSVDDFFSSCFFVWKTMFLGVRVDQASEEDPTLRYS